jgi:hypothetical protein
MVLVDSAVTETERLSALVAARRAGGGLGD